MKGEASSTAEVGPELRDSGAAVCLKHCQQPVDRPPT